MVSDHVIEQLQFDEGYCKNTYNCSEGKLTVGYGYNLESNELQLPVPQIAKIKREGLPQVEAYQMLLEIVDKRSKTLHDALPWLSKLSPARRAVLLNMSYQLGVPGLLKFSRTLAAAQRGDYATCSVYMLESKWAKQTPARAKRLAAQMHKGEYTYNSKGNI
jgi:lysozyme